MIWVVSLIIALLAYFIFQGLHARHVSRCHTDDRTAEHIPDSITTPKAQAEFHQQSAVTAAQVQRQRIREPQNLPSLLYADRSNTTHSQVDNHDQYPAQNQQPSSDAPVSDTSMSDATLEKSSTPTSSTQCTPDDIIDMELVTNHTADHTLEFTAEHEPMRDVGVPDTNKEYAESNAPGNDTNTGVIAASAAVAAAAGIASTTTDADATNEKFNEEYAQYGYDVQQQSTTEHSSSQSLSTGTTENIDLELGTGGETDNTYNDTEDIEGNNHDELLDFGDLTSDISEMLKELNLRETDSPRLDINKAEYEQLKTGEPGEVKPAKIENVADKLRNMLQ